MTMQQADAPTAQTQSPSTSSPQLLKTVVGTLAFVLLFVGSVLQLSGVGAAHSECNELFRDKLCRDPMRQHWWAIFFELVMGLGTGVVLLLGILESVVVAVGVFLAMATVKIMDSAEVFLQVDGDDRWPDTDHARLAVAGFLLSAIGNFLLIFVIGVSKKPKPQWPNMPHFLQLNQTPPLPNGYPQMPVSSPQQIPQLPQMQQVASTSQNHWRAGGSVPPSHVQLQTTSNGMTQLPASLTPPYYTTHSPPVTHLPAPPRPRD